MISNWAEVEMQGSIVPDKRYRASLAGIVLRLGTRAQESFSAACGSALRQSASRLFHDPIVKPEHLIAGHVKCTVERCEGQNIVFAASDTTEVDYSTHVACEGLGTLSSKHTRGFLTHSVLAISERGAPLGLLHQSSWVRPEEQFGISKDRAKRPTDEKESQKWLDALTGVEAALPAEQKVVLIQDREADIFDFLAMPRRPNTHLLVRVGRARNIQSETCEPTLLDIRQAARSAPILGQMTITVPDKPGRKEHDTTLDLRACKVAVPPPKDRPAKDKDIRHPYWVVCARERDVAEGDDPIEWLLMTDLAVTDHAMAATIVHWYTLRWMVERFHYTLKSGCRIEQLQMNTAKTLMNAVAVLSVVAWHLLSLTYQARTQPDMPAEHALNALERTVLERAVASPIKTIRDVVRAIAKLGGFAGNPAAGNPGVKSLWLGYRRLNDMVAGFELAMSPPNLMIQD